MATCPSAPPSNVQIIQHQFYLVLQTIHWFPNGFHNHREGVYARSAYCHNGVFIVKELSAAYNQEKVPRLYNMYNFSD